MLASAIGAGLRRMRLFRVVIVPNTAVRWLQQFRLVFDVPNSFLVQRYTTHSQTSELL